MSTSIRKGFVRFDDAMDRAKALVRFRAGDLGGRMILLRDLYGRISVIVDAERSDRHAAIAEELHEALGAYSPGRDEVLVFRGELFGLDMILGAKDALPLFEVAGDTIRVLDRQIIGQDWLRPPLHVEPEEGPKRLAFFGIKGGVGRSTALAVLAHKLVQADKRVLVIDLDLESPGLSTTLLSEGCAPDFGVVDWLVEDVVGQADEVLLGEMVATSPLAPEGGGVVRVVPAGGSKGDYIAKLTRAYTDDGDAGSGFAEQLEKMIEALEAVEEPDVVLLDSRAGLHDIAAATLTRLGALAFLFAGNTAQTWYAYELLFRRWHHHPTLPAIRENLRMVAALVPETGRDSYLGQVREQSYRLFQEYFYEDVAPGDVSPFNFDLHTTSAPHYPLEIYWSRALQEFDPVRRPGALTPDQLEAAYGAFIRGAVELLGLTLPT